MKKKLVVKSNVRAGALTNNHNTVARTKKLVVKSNVRAGTITTNHNAVVR